MADFAYRPDFSAIGKPDYNVLVNKFENNIEHRRLISSTKLRTFDLEFKYRGTTEMEAVLDFYDDKFGPLTAFTLTVNGEDILGRFVEKSFEYEQLAPAVWNYRFQFQEVII